MTRRIKRLRDQAPTSVQQRKRDDPGAWDAAMNWWRSVGINTDLLVQVLERVLTERRRYESALRGHAESFGAWEAGRARTALRRAGALIQLLKTERAEDDELVFGDLGERVEQAIEQYAASREQSALPAHRPGEPWLKRRVLRLARCLRAREQSWSRSERAIHGLFVLAGHGDVVTLDKIRHIVRQERGRNPSFGPKMPDPRDRPWFVPPIA